MFVLLSICLAGLAFQSILVLAFSPAQSKEGFEAYHPQSTAQRFHYFDLELLRTFDENENYFVSPASIKAVLGMILEGAGGQTAKQIRKTLRIPADGSSARARLQALIYDIVESKSDTIIELANAALVSNNYKINPSYAKNLTQYYKAEVSSVDFSNGKEAAKIVNNWVNNKTRGFVQDLVNPDMFGPDVSIILANALYFKGTWKLIFDEKNTFQKRFRTSTGHTTVNMMQMTDNFNYAYINELDAQAVELQYNDGKYGMLLLLPSETHSVDDLIRDIQHTSFVSIVQQLEPSEVELEIPKFEIDYSKDLAPTLQEMGMEEAFGPEANLTGIILQGHPKVSKILHKAKIIVDEKGTEAAAATGGLLIPLMASKTPTFVADRPFLFFIYHIDSANILFEGRVNEPPEATDSPAAEVDEPVKAQVQKQEEEVQEPEKEVQKPEKEVQKPEKEVQKPEKEVQKPVKELQKPEKVVPVQEKNPEKDVQIPQKVVPVQEKKVQNLEKDVQVPEKVEEQVKTSPEVKRLAAPKPVAKPVKVPEEEHDFISFL